MPKDAENSDAVTYLKNNGPCAKRDLPVSSLGENVRRLIRSLNISGGSGGGGSGEPLGGGTLTVAYLENEHDFEQVIQTWLRLNSEAIANLSPESLRRRLRDAVSQDRKDVVSEVLDREGYSVDHSDRGHSYSQKFECSLCGTTVKDIASHLSNCSER